MTVLQAAVGCIRPGAGVSHIEARRAALSLVRTMVLENQRLRDIRGRLNEVFPHLGPWTSQRVTDAICQLRRGTLGIEPLPEILPADAEKEQVLAAIAAGLQAGKGWTAIARQQADETDKAQPPCPTGTG